MHEEVEEYYLAQAAEYEDLIRYGKDLSEPLFEDSLTESGRNMQPTEIVA